MVVRLRLEAAPIAAFVATKGGGRVGPAPDAQREAGTQRRMTGAGDFASRCKAPLGRGGKSLATGIACPARLTPRSPSQKAVGVASQRRRWIAMAEPAPRYRLAATISL
ncbi:hypothetical protein [Brucella anthropi]|uniref:hypothetical protein n=1 Tax=Brucella anthropi TaxID=529 RepID=UPI0021577CE3|nr:hypothetical protein [Brucella anthropi]MCR8493023.1 hypothetical protein [Brucella anthropi]